jgi:hypothetical protein
MVLVGTMHCGDAPVHTASRSYGNVRPSTVCTRRSFESTRSTLACTKRTRLFFFLFFPCFVLLLLLLLLLLLDMN